MRLEPLIEEETTWRQSCMSALDLRVYCLRPGHNEHFVASTSVLRNGN